MPLGGSFSSDRLQFLSAHIAYQLGAWLLPIRQPNEPSRVLRSFDGSLFLLNRSAALTRRRKHNDAQP